MLKRSNLFKLVQTCSNLLSIASRVRAERLFQACFLKGHSHHVPEHYYVAASFTITVNLSILAYTSPPAVSTQSIGESGSAARARGREGVVLYRQKSGRGSIISRNRQSRGAQKRGGVTFGAPIQRGGGRYFLGFQGGPILPPPPPPRFMYGDNRHAMRACVWPHRKCRVCHATVSKVWSVPHAHVCVCV